MKRSILLLVIFLVASCGGGGGGSTTPPNTTPTASISGIVSAPAGSLAYLESESFPNKIINFLVPLATAEITGIAPVANTNVELIELNNNGAQVGAPIASAMTDRNGMFVIEIEVTPSPQLQLRVGSGDSEMRAFVTSETTNIDPASEYIVESVTAEIAAVAEMNLSLFTLTEIQEMLALIVSENIDLSSVMTVNDALVQIDSIVGSNIDSSIATAAIDLTGEWTSRVVTLESNCGDPVNIVYLVEALNIQQTGNTVTFNYDGGVTTQATLSGLEFTDISLTSYPDGEGTTTETALTLSLNNEVNGITGELSWNWSSPSIPLCSGRSQMVFTSAETPTMLEGTYVGECFPMGIGTPASSLFLETYQGRHYSFEAQGFNNDTCTGTPLATKSGSGYVYLGDDILTNSGSVTATEIEVEIVTTSMAGQAGTIADNVGGFETGQLLYDLAYLNGNQIYYGDASTGDRTIAINRPTDIDLSFFLTRQQ